MIKLFEDLFSSQQSIIFDLNEVIYNPRIFHQIVLILKQLSYYNKQNYKQMSFTIDKIIFSRVFIYQYLKFLILTELTLSLN